jgi:hypothetical protein
MDVCVTIWSSTDKVLLIMLRQLHAGVSITFKSGVAAVFACISSAHHGRIVDASLVVEGSWQSQDPQHQQHHQQLVAPSASHIVAWCP